MGVPVGELFWMERHRMNPGDDRIGQESIGKGLGLGVGDAQDVVAVAGGDGGADAGECEDGIGYGLGGWVHDAGEWVDFDEGAAWFRSTNDGSFNDGVGQKPVDDPVELVFGEIGFDEVDSAPMGPFEGESDGFGVVDQRVCPWIADGWERVDFDPVDGLSLGEIGR